VTALLRIDDRRLRVQKIVLGILPTIFCALPLASIAFGAVVMSASVECLVDASAVVGSCRSGPLLGGRPAVGDRFGCATGGEFVLGAFGRGAGRGGVLPPHAAGLVDLA
jgi:hypothetical protein